jgi:hypothetical protein
MTKICVLILLYVSAGLYDELLVAFPHSRTVNIGMQIHTHTHNNTHTHTHTHKHSRYSGF